MISLERARLRIKVLRTLSLDVPLKFSQLHRKLRLKVQNDKLLDNALQDLRCSGQIKYSGKGWLINNSFSTE